MEKVVIYTDGACSGNPGPGGWGSILMYKEKGIKYHGNHTAHPLPAGGLPAGQLPYGRMYRPPPNGP